MVPHAPTMVPMSSLPSLPPLSSILPPSINSNGNHPTTSTQHESAPIQMQNISAPATTKEKPRKIKLLKHLAQLAIDLVNIQKRDEYIGASKAMKLLNVGSLQTMINYQKILVCIIRKNKEECNHNGIPPLNELKYKLDDTFGNLSIGTYVSSVLGYRNNNQLYTDKRNNPGVEFVPELRWLGIVTNTE